MRDKEDDWDSIKDTTGIDYREAARRGNDNDLPKGCWVLMGYCLALVWGVGGIVLLFALLHFVSIRRVFTLGGMRAVVVVSIMMIVGGILVGIATTKSLR